jgi:hypothetical protein
MDVWDRQAAAIEAGPIFESAQYTPAGGVAVTVRAQFGDPQIPVSMAGAGFKVEAPSIRVRTMRAPNLKRGDRFLRTKTGETFEVSEPPDRTDDATFWDAAVRKVKS